MAFFVNYGDCLAASIHQNGWLGRSLARDWLPQCLRKAVCLSQVDWLTGPLARAEIGCQICVWLQAPLPDYRTLCSPV